MVKIVSKTEIDTLDNEKFVEDKRESLVLAQQARPIKRQPMVSAPRTIRMPRPAAAPKPKVSREQIEALIARQKPPPQPPRYTEYRQSLSNSIDSALSLVEKDSNMKGGLVDKIASSRDIQTIVKDRVFDLIDPVTSNDVLALITTIGSFYLENKLS